MNSLTISFKIIVVIFCIALAKKKKTKRKSIYKYPFVHLKETTRWNKRQQNYKLILLSDKVVGEKQEVQMASCAWKHEQTHKMQLKFNCFSISCNK